MKRRTVHLLRFFPFLVWLLAIGILSLVPSPPTPDVAFLSWDKFQHAGAYALLTFLAGYACLPYVSFAAAWFIAFASAIFFGGGLEVAQGALTAVRAPEWGDLVADALGAALVLIGAFCLRRNQPAVADD